MVFFLSGHCSAELEKLSVKQLKEILMLNRVDFKGCCEKNELLERVTRLWNDHRTYPCKYPKLSIICRFSVDFYLSGSR